MTDLVRAAPAIVYALFLWWFGTGLILYLDGLPRSSHRRSLLWASGILVLSAAGIAWSRSHTGAWGAYLAFSGAIGVWAWNEMAFLMGFVTGPRREACPEGCGGWRRLGHALATLLYHELALLASGAVVLGLTWNAPNPTAAWTFLVLWIMRVSAKLNVFLGVPNLSIEFLPEGLGYLASYFRRAPMNLLFPVSVTGATVALLWMADRSLAPGTSGAEAVGMTLAAALLALALLEHWLFVLPLPANALWSWGLSSRQSLGQPGETGGSREAARGSAGGLDPGAPAPRRGRSGAS